MPDAGLLDQDTADLELNHVIFTAPVARRCVRVVGPHVQRVERLALVGLSIFLSVNLAVYQCPHDRAVGHVLAVHLDRAPETGGQGRDSGQSRRSPGEQQGHNQAKGE